MTKATTRSRTKRKAGANDKQVGGKHYKAIEIEPWDYIAANDLDFFTGSVVKYVTRWEKKGGIPDLKKAKHFIKKLIEIKTRKRKRK